MSRNLRLGALALIAFLFVSAFSSPGPHPSAFAQSSYLNAYQISDDGSMLYIAYNNETDYSVDISGLQVDITCATNATFSSLDTVRLDLLKQGCARIIGTPKNSAEQAAQAGAKANRIGIWSPSPSPSSAGESPSSAGRHHSSGGSILGWIKRHKLISVSSVGLLVAILASPLLLKFGGWIVALFYRRKVHIILAGAAAAGKTGLWMAWKDEYSTGGSGRISNLPPTAGTHPARMEPVRLVKWTLQPTLIDTAGAEPWHVLKEIQGAKGFKAPIRRRQKRILLYVVAPCAEERAASGEPFDASYIARQEGYTALPIAIIRQPNRYVRPDLVMMFATKFDLLSNISPKDSDVSVVEKMAAAFKPHRELVESACATANVPFVWIVGSAKRDWSIEQLRRGLARVIT